MIVIVLFGALCFIIPAIIWGLFILAFRMRSREAIGTIIDYDIGHSEHGEVSAPIVEFQLPDGTKITFTEPTHSNETILDVVSDLFSKFALKKDLNKVKVIYDPNNPQKARVNTFGNLYFMPALLFLIGAGIILYTIPAAREFFTPIFNFIDRITK